MIPVKLCEEFAQNVFTLYEPNKILLLNLMKWALKKRNEISRG